MGKRRPPADDVKTGKAPDTEPDAKDFALRRLREAPDEELAVFVDSLRQGALAAGATEQELRDAQSGHPGHG
jgi:hypothetical protein